jgi:hypothetical protein
MMTVRSHAGLNYVTPLQLLKEHPDSELSLEELKALANQPDKTCFVCGSNPVWKYGECGMCFTCTTGEADGSDDYELLEEE